jgi:hypothetical protein
MARPALFAARGYVRLIRENREHSGRCCLRRAMGARSALISWLWLLSDTSCLQARARRTLNWLPPTEAGGDSEAGGSDAAVPVVRVVLAFALAAAVVGVAQGRAVRGTSAVAVSATAFVTNWASNSVSTIGREVQDQAPRRHHRRLESARGRGHAVSPVTGQV